MIAPQTQLQSHLTTDNANHTHTNSHSKYMVFSITQSTTQPHLHPKYLQRLKYSPIKTDRQLLQAHTTRHDLHTTSTTNEITCCPVFNYFNG